MSQGEQLPAQPAQQPDAVPVLPATPVPAIGDDQWNKDVTGILTSNANNTLSELGFNPNVLRAFKGADHEIARLKAEKKSLENKSRDLSAHLALANNRIDFAKLDAHAQWKEVIYYREKYHVLQRQHQETLRAHSTCAVGPPEQPYIHLLQELEKQQDMYRHILGQNTTLKFEVQRLMQQCVNAGLIPPPQNYNVTPLPTLQPPVLQPAAARRVSEPAIVGLQQQTQGVQPGPAVRQFASSPSSLYTPNRPVANNPMIVAGPAQAYTYHRAQFPQHQQAPTQLMPPPQQQIQQGQPSVARQLIPTTRPRPATDPANTEDERIPKRPRMASDPNVSTRRSPGTAYYPQHPLYAQVSVQVPLQSLQQRTPQPRPRMVPTDHTQDQPMQPHNPQRSVTAPTNRAEPSTLSHVGPSRASSLPDITTSIPTPPTSAPLVMDAHRAAGVAQAQDQPPDAHSQTQGIDQPQQAHAGPAHSVSVASPPASTPVAPPPDSVPVSPRAVNSQAQGGELTLPPLTEEQTQQMRSELADSMFTEPKEDDEKQARECVLCDHRNGLGLLTVPLQPLYKPTVEEMYLHLQAEHPESLEIEERDWKMELFGMGPVGDQQQ